MQLRHINIRALIAEAGGDPWAIEHSLHAGRPAQIAELAEAFHAAGRCTAEANAAFEEARRRFEASWNRENGEHPINDSAEVQRVTAALGVQSLQLPKIGVDLENIAADLAEAQRAAAGRIATLESQLQRIDDQLDQALELEHDPRLAAAERSELDALITCLEQDAIDDTASALGQLQSIRAGDLQAVRAGFSFTSCNDQGDPPYQGTVRMAFLLQGDHDAYFQHVRAAMLSHGWIDGPPPGQYFHGITLHKNGVTANMSLALDHSYGEMILDGECRNTTDHHHDDETTNITNQLVQP